MLGSMGQHGEPVDVRHHEIENDELISMLIQQLDARTAISGRIGFKACSRQEAEDQGSNRLVIFDDECSHGNLLSKRFANRARADESARVTFAGAVSTLDAWNPDQYHRFAAERRQPFEDLLSLIQRGDSMRVIDLGCGSGELTRHLHVTLGANDTLGIDSSPAMLQRASEQTTERLRFELGDIDHYAFDGQFDLIFSNAAVHWVPDHERLFTRFAEALKPHGQLAIQMPANYTHPSHTSAEDVARDPEFAHFLSKDPHPRNLLPADEYARILFRLGFRRQHVREQIYLHVLPSRNEIVEWVRGTLLTAYQQTLPGNQFERFVERYRERLFEQVPDTKPFPFTYRRVLIWGEK